MSISNDVDTIIQKRNSKVEELEEREKRIKEIYTNIERLETQKNKVIEDDAHKAILNKAVWESIQELDIRTYRIKWNEFQKAFKEVKNRFSRNTINIAVVGGARQGKSKLLQTISGLDDKVIPAFSTTDCTGTTSLIKNVRGESLRADITFRSEREMIEVVQAYLDDMLGKNVKRIEAFGDIAKIDLESIGKEIRGSAKTARLEHLKKYVEHFEEWSPCVREKEVSIRDAEEIKTFVAQHNGKIESDPKREDYYKYLAVKEAVISCEFQLEDAGKIVLQDTIGLGDTSLGIDDAMLDTIAKNSDAAIIVKRPEISSGKFDDRDVELYRKLEENFNRKNMGKWLFWLTNETKGEPYGNNSDRCRVVDSKIESLGWELAGHEVVDVSDSEQVNEQFLHTALTKLVQNMDSIDSGLISELDGMADELYREYMNLQDRVQQILNSEVKNSANVHKIVLGRWYDFYNQTFMRKFKEYVKEWGEKEDKECTEFREYIDNILDGARSMVPDTHELMYELQAGGHHGQESVYRENLDRLRTRFTGKFLDIDEEIFDKMVMDVKEYFVKLFAEDDGGRMKYIRAVDETRPGVEWLTYAVEDIFKSEDYIEFKTAFEILNRFKLTVRGFLMYKVRRRVKIMELETGNEEFRNTGTYEEQSEEIWRLLDRKMKKVCDALRVDLAEIYREPNEILAAVIKEFYDRLNFSSIPGKTTAEDLWKSLYFDNCTKVWWEEFKDEEEKSDMYRAWEDIETALKKYTRQDFLVSSGN